jgi:hypothetical protein
MAEQKVELRKVRDFSENQHDTFLFIRQNLKPLFTSFIAIAGIFMLAHSILTGMYQRNSISAFRDIFNGRTMSDAGLNSPFATMFNGTYFLVLFLAWANFVAMNVVVTSYMKLYDTSDGVAPTIEEVWNEFKKHFFTVLFSTIPITLLIVVGFLFCLIPGIYLSVVLTPFAIILMVEEQSIGGAWNRCFAIIKENFWPSFGLYFLVYLICAFSGGIISAIVAGVAGAISYFTTQNIAATVGIVTSVLNIFSYVFYIIFYVSVNLHYYNLAEKHDGTGIMRRLDTLGRTTGDFNSTQEEY